MLNYPKFRTLQGYLLAATVSALVLTPSLSQQNPTTAPIRPISPPQTVPPPDEYDQTDNPRSVLETDDQRKARTAPANPLVLKQPDGRGNARNLYDEKGRKIEKLTPQRKLNFGDYRGRNLDPRVRPMTMGEEDLPLFGYSFFEPARNFLIAKQQYIQRLLTGELNPDGSFNPDYTNPDTSDNGTGNLNPSPNLPQNSQGRRNAPLNPNGKRRTTVDPHDNSDPNNNPEDNTQARRRVRTKNNSTGRAYDPNLPIDENTDESQDNPEDATGAMQPRRNVPVRRNRTNSQTDNTSNPRESSPQNANRDEVNGNSGNLRDPRYSRDNDTAGSSANNPNNSNGDGSGYSNNRNNSNGNTNRRNGTFSASPFGGFADTNAFSSIADPLAQLRGNVLASVPSTYVLSGGDKLVVSYRTPTLPDNEFRLTVDPQGAISLPEAGRIIVGGQTLAQAQANIERKLGLTYRGVSASVSLQELRTISVTVSGEVFQPGTYPVPSVTSAINVLYAAGGPTERGSLRRIEVRRAGKLIGAIDIYRFLTGGEQPDIPLQSGDLITILPRQSQITVRGEVRTPAIFELKDNETLGDALRFAGGVKPSGVSQNVRLETVIPGRERVIKTVDFKTNTQSRAISLYDGDSVDVFSVRDTVANQVTIEGAVDQPSDYAFTPGQTIADLIDRARGLIPEAYTPRAELYRWNPDNTTTLVTVDLDRVLTRDPQANLKLNRWDRLRVYTRQEVAWTGTRKVELTGAVQKPGTYERSVGMRLTDLLRRAGGTAPDAYLNRVVVLHQHPDGTFAYEYPNLYTALTGNLEADVMIQDNDLVAVYKTSEANFTPERVVSVRGEVVAPGVYPRGDEMKLSDLIKNAGGFRPGANPKVTVAHARKYVDAPNAQAQTITVTVNERGIIANDLPLSDGDVVTIQADGNFQSEVRVVTVKGFVNRPGPITLNRKGMRLSDAIAEAGGLNTEGSPEGTEFNRDPKMLASTGQKTIMQKVSQLSDLINSSAYRRELAKSDIERSKALRTAETDNGGILGSVTGGGATPATPTNPIVAQNLANRDLVSKPRVMGENDLTPNGNIAVNLPEALRKPGGEEDILLVDGDVITVPEKPTTIQVSGAVVNPRGVLFKAGANIDYYITRAGGFAPDVAKDRIVIIRAGGGIFPANKAGILRAGDLIFVPTRVVAEKISSNGNLFNDLFKGITSTAVSILVATKLFGL